MTMSGSIQKRTLHVVTACMNASGCPCFALTRAAVTQDELENGVHYYLVEADLMERGYEEPMTHFDEDEAPVFLHAAVREYLGMRPGDDVPIVTAAGHAVQQQWQASSPPGPRSQELLGLFAFAKE
jgi:hypothetical protein